MKIGNLLLLCLVFFVASCSTDIVDNDFYCEKKGEYLGDYPLEPASDSLFPYEINQKLIFVNAANEEVTLEQMNYSNTSSIMNIRTVCGGPNLPAYEFDSYTHHEKRAQYRSTDYQHYIMVQVNNQVIERTDNTFYVMDMLTVYGATYINFVASDRGNPDLVPDYLTGDGIQRLADTTLLGYTFEDVYFYKNSFTTTTELFYNPTFGVVAYRRYDGELWVLDRIE